MPAAAKLMTATSVVAGCLLLAAPAHAAKTGWVDAGGTRSGQVAADPEQEEILGSITSTGGPAGRSRSAGAAGDCRWLRGLDAAAQVPVAIAV